MNYMTQALADARKLHPDVQMYMQVITAGECQTIDKERDRYIDIIKSKVLSTDIFFAFSHFACICFFRTWPTGLGFASCLGWRYKNSLALSTFLMSAIRFSSMHWEIWTAAKGILKLFINQYFIYLFNYIFSDILYLLYIIICTHIKAWKTTGRDIQLLLRVWANQISTQHSGSDQQ